MMDALTFYAREPLQELSRLTSALDEKQTLRTAEKENIRRLAAGAEYEERRRGHAAVCAAIEVRI